MLKKLSLVALVLGVGVVTAASAISAPANADQPEDLLCTQITAGLGYEAKVDTVGDPATVSYTAPTGYLVDSYCVKAATDPVIVQVVPPSATVTIDHPTKDSVSHYQVHLITVPELVASASVSKTPATCEAGEVLVYGAITNATYDESSTPDGATGPADYEVIAIADEGAEFTGESTFTGTLTGPLTDASCDEDGEVLGTVTPTKLPVTSGDSTIASVAILSSVVGLVTILSLVARSVLTRQI